MEILVIAIAVVIALILHTVIKDRRTFKSIDKRLARIEGQLGICNDKQRKTRKNN